jgi:hypothetical protein
LAQDRASRNIRIATIILWAMVPIGIALILIGVIEVRWWLSGDTSRLLGLLDKVTADNGLARPILLRGRVGAFELIALGGVSLGYACLALFVRKGKPRAATVGIVAGLVLLLYSLIEIGVEATFGTGVSDYLAQLALYKPVPGATAADLTPLFPPTWYSWFEDIAQGLLAIGLLASTIALAATLIVGGEQALAAREEPTGEFGRALRRFADERRAAGSE